MFKKRANVKTEDVLKEICELNGLTYLPTQKKIYVDIEKPPIVRAKYNRLSITRVASGKIHTNEGVAVIDAAIDATKTVRPKKCSSSLINVKINGAPTPVNVKRSFLTTNKSGTKKAIKIVD